MFCSFLLDNLGFIVSMGIIACLMVIFFILYFIKSKQIKTLKDEIGEKEKQVEIYYHNLNIRENDLNTQTEILEKEKILLKQEKEKLIQDQENLNNAMRLFKQQKEAHDNLNSKSEKDIAIDLYLKFLDLENSFTFFQTNLASVDSKLIGVKDYSDDLARMKEEVMISKDTVVNQMIDSKDSVINELKVNKNEVINEISVSRKQFLDTYNRAAGEIQALKNEMTNLQSMYSGELRNILLALNSFLTEVQGNIQKIVIDTFDGESKKYFADMYQFAGTIDQKINLFNSDIVNIVNGKLGAVCSNIETKTMSIVNSSVSQYIGQYDNHISSFKNHVGNIVELMDNFNNDFENRFNNLSEIIEESYGNNSFYRTISDAVESGIDDAFSSYSVTDKIKDSAKEGMEECINDYHFKDAVKDAVSDCLEDDMENKIRSAIDDEISYTLNRIESDVSDIKSKTDDM